MTRVRVERVGAVGRVVLARPEKKNALDRQTADELSSALADLEGDDAVRAVVLAADGPDFCAGADLEALEAMLDAGADEHRRDAEALGRVFLALRSLSKPVVAAVRGRALAGGAGLATACDIVLAHENAQFGYPEVRIGFVPAMVMTILRRCVGERQAFDLVATGRMLGAHEARDLGLASRVLAEAEFEPGIAEVAAALAKTPAAALRLTKRLFYALDDTPFEQGIALGVGVNVEARGTEDFRSGVRRFVRGGRGRA